MRYSRSCVQYSDFLDRAQLLTQMLLKQGYDAPIYGLHHNLVDSYKISIFQMTATDVGEVDYWNVEVIAFDVEFCFNLPSLSTSR
jgi:hypothetical protein